MGRASSIPDRTDSKSLMFGWPRPPSHIGPQGRRLPQLVPQVALHFRCWVAPGMAVGGTVTVQPPCPAGSLAPFAPRHATVYLF